MRAVLVIEEDPLIRELMREHLERQGYATCALASVRGALEAQRWTTFGLVLMDFDAAAAAEAGELTQLRAPGAPVVMMSTAPRGRTVALQGEVASVVWSPFDLATLTRAVHRFLAPETRATERAAVEPKVTSSGTYAKFDRRPIGEITTLPAPPDGELEEDPRPSLEALGALVLEATGGRSKR